MERASLGWVLVGQEQSGSPCGCSMRGRSVVGNEVGKGCADLGFEL